MKKLLLATLVSALGLLVPLSAVAQGVWFSEYCEGTASNKALEIFNFTGQTVDLTTDCYRVLLYMNGATTATYTISLTGTLAHGDVFVLANPNANATLLACADMTSASLSFNGDDAIVLVRGITNAVLDVIGQVGVDPGSEWGTDLTSTSDNTLRRKIGICMGDMNPMDAFNPVNEWDGYACNTFDGFGAHTTICQLVPALGPTWGSLKSLYR